LFFGSAAHAIPLRWTLNDFIFEDGQMATGSFVYDADSGIFSDIDIVTGANSDWNVASVNYDNLGFTSLPGGDLFTHAIPCNAAGDHCTLVIRLEGELTSNGGTVVGGMLERNQQSNVRKGAGVGYISAVPVPAAVWLFASALAGLGMVRRRR
jgi:hypothetical protein